MKIIAIQCRLGVLLCLLITAAGCYKDKGNYAYQVTNAVLVSDTLARGIKAINKGDTLVLTPAVSQTMVSGDANLSYEWSFTTLNGGSTLRRILARTKQLKAVMDSNFVLGFSYVLTYKVTDNNSGESVFLKYNISIGNKYSQGWMLLEDKGGTTDFSMILPDGEVVHDVYKTLNGVVLADKPVRMQISTFLVSDGVNEASRKLYLLMEHGGMEIDYTRMSRRYDYGGLFYTAPAVIQPTYTGFPSSATSMGSAINNGKLYINAAGPFPGIKKWGGALVSPENKLNYELAPFVISGPGINGNVYPVVVYDKVGKRFCGVSGTGASLDSFARGASTLFDMNHTGMELIYMDNSPAGQANAFMKDATGQVQFCRFRMSYTAVDSVLTLMKQPVNDAAIADMHTAASSLISDHVFYGTGNKIYRYEPASNTTALQFSFPANEQVTIIKCPMPLADAPQVAAVTWDGAQSRLYLFYINAMGGIDSYSIMYGGFGKVVDAEYKFRY